MIEEVESALSNENKMINYLEEFPLSKSLLPDKLVKFLSPIDSLQRDLMIDITSATEKKNYDADEYESCRMVMTTLPANQIDSFDAMDINANVIESMGEPCCDNKGELTEGLYWLKKLSHLVVSWSNGGFFNYALSQEVAIMLGLSLRCIGSGEQTMIYDDLSIPIMTIARGEISHEYYYKQSRDVTWTIRNDYLRKYLWRRGHIGIRSFRYEGFLSESSETAALMKDCCFKYQLQ